MKSVKKLSLIALALLLSVIVGNAQNAGSTAQTPATVAMNQPTKTKHVKQAKVATDNQATQTTSIATPSIATNPVVIKEKYSKKMKPATNNQASSTASAPATTPPSVSKAPTAKTETASDNQSIGKDAKGRTLYKGSRGGIYYLTEKGNKEYVKQ